jgi:membrane protease YdiL (CAAX protease family)
VRVTKSEHLRAIGRVAVSILLGLLVLNLVAAVTVQSGLLSSSTDSQPWAGGFLSHTTMWVASMLLILIVSKGRLSVYGFRKGNRYKIVPIVGLGTAIGAAFAVVLQIFPEGADILQRDYSFAETVVFIWLYASICEEILTRGLIQGFLTPLERYGFRLFSVRISLPVVTGALFFGLMHMAVLTTGVALSSVIVYVVFASVLGLVAGYYREQTGSIFPAVLVHMFGNIGGYCADLLIH